MMRTKLWRRGEQPIDSVKCELSCFGFAGSLIIADYFASLVRHRESSCGESVRFHLLAHFLDLRGLLVEALLVSCSTLAGKSFRCCATVDC